MNENLHMLRTEPRFARLLAASFISGIGDWFNTVAVLTFLFTLTGSGLAVGISASRRVSRRIPCAHCRRHSAESRADLG